MRIAVIPGDGIGQEVVPAVLPLLDRLATLHDFDVEYSMLDWGADRWLRDGVGIPVGGLAEVAEHSAILHGAIGDPRIPDMAHGREILLGLRRGLDLYANVRPLVIGGRALTIYRENTQGLYAGIGGTVEAGGQAAVAVDQAVTTRDLVERFVRFSVQDAQAKGHGKITLVHKSNAVPHTGRLWEAVFREQLEGTGLETTSEYVDAFCYHLVRDAARYEAVITSNLFGDIVSDVGAALTPGGLGTAASANVCPETGMGLFEPVHGSAPDIAGRGVANPIATIGSLAMMLDHLGEVAAGDALRIALQNEAVGRVATPDLGGSATTVEVVRRIEAAVVRAASLAPQPELR